MSELYLVRHAQARLGASNYDELSALGEQQAAWLGDYFNERNIKFDRLVSGDMQRHKQTLEIISERMGGVSEYTTRAGFNEYDFKKIITVFGQQYPDDDIYNTTMKQTADKRQYFRLLQHVLLKWSQDQIADLDEGWQDFYGRVTYEMNLLKENANSGERVLVISSGGAISMFISQVLGALAGTTIELNLQMKNTGINQFVYNKDKISLGSFNAIPHLDQPDRFEHITYV